MITEILDELITQSSENSWIIKYVALSPDYMTMLTNEVFNFVGKDFKVATLLTYKEVNLKVKEIVGFQVAYELAPDAE